MQRTSGAQLLMHAGAPSFCLLSHLHPPTSNAGRRTIRRPIVAAGDADANAALGLRATANALHLATTRGAAGATLGSTGPLVGREWPRLLPRVRIHVYTHARRYYLY